MRMMPLKAKWIYAVVSCGLFVLPIRAAAGEEAQDRAASETLGSLLAEADANHPAILSAQAQVRAEEERPAQAGSLPDPVVGVTASNYRVDNLALDSSPMAGLVLRFKQGIPFPGKLGRRRDLAEAGAEISRRIENEVASDVRAQVQAKYWQLSGASAVEKITRENLAVLEEFIGVANSRFAVGMGSQQDVLQAQAVLAELEAQLIQREQERRNAERDLNVSVGRLADAPAVSAPPYPMEALAYEETDLAQLADELNPQLVVRIARVKAAEAALAEASHDRWPDFGIGGGYRFRQQIDNGISDGSDMVFLALDMSLPVYAGSKQNRRVAETRARLAAAQHAEMDVRLKIGAMTLNLFDESQRILAQARLFRDEVIPQDQFALDAAVSDYSVGDVEFVTIISNWQSILRDEIALERLTASLGVRRAELEFMVGRKFQ